MSAPWSVPKKSGSYAVYVGGRSGRPKFKRYVPCSRSLIETFDDDTLSQWRIEVDGSEVSTLNFRPRSGCDVVLSLNFARKSEVVRTTKGRASSQSIRTVDIPLGLVSAGLAARAAEIQANGILANARDNALALIKKCDPEQAAALERIPDDEVGPPTILKQSGEGAELNARAIALITYGHARRAFAAGLGSSERMVAATLAVHFNSILCKLDRDDALESDDQKNDRIVDLVQRELDANGGNKMQAYAAVAEREDCSAATIRTRFTAAGGARRRYTRPDAPFRSNC